MVILVICEMQFDRIEMTDDSRLSAYLLFNM